MNPNGTAYVIDDGGFVLWESNAIVTWLGLRHGRGMLVDGSPETLGRAVQWMSWTNEHLEPHLHTLVMELRRQREDLRSPGAVTASAGGIAPALRILDAHLADNAYVTGERFSMGDIPPGAAVRRWQVFAQAGPPRRTWMRGSRGSRSARASGATSRRWSCTCDRRDRSHGAPTALVPLRLRSRGARSGRACRRELALPCTHI